MIDNEAPAPAPEGRPWGVRTGLDLVEVRGPDAVAYLQGQLSQDVAGLAVGSWAPSLLLEPQGKVTAWMRVGRLVAGEAGDRLVLVADRGFGAQVEQRLRRFWLRTNATLEVRELVPTLAVREWPHGAALPEQRDGALVVPAPWPGAAGFDLVGLGAEVPDGVTVLEGEAGRACLERARILAGVPAMGSELGPETIPAAAGVVEGAVDFTKGCYTGQELVARVDSRGNRTPTRLVVLSGTAPAPEPGVELSHDGQPRATVTSAVADGDAWVGLGYLHRSIETPAELDDHGEVVVAVDRP